MLTPTAPPTAPVAATAAGPGDLALPAPPGVRWRRAWPGKDGRLVLEGLEGLDDLGTAGRVVAATARPVLRDGRLVGADDLAVVDDDPRLPALAALRAGGATLTAHRAGKRAVLREGPPGAPRAFAKVAGSRATRTALDRLAALRALLAASGAPARPRLVDVLDADPGAGVLRLAPAPGRDLTSLLARAGAGECRAAGRATGRALAALATAPTTAPATAPAAGPALPVHTGADEAAVLTRWVADARAHGVLPGDLAAALERAADDVAAALRAAGPEGPAPLVPAHRDLHDGQVLVDGTGGTAGWGRVTLLDVDTAALADPCLDAGNLLAHLDLARLLLGPARAAAVDALEDGLRAGWAEAGHPLLAAAPERLELHRAAARLRVVAVHAFRGRARLLAPLARPAQWGA
ncbi:phosphotransferase family protein [Kineococcus terrestris]|uniref:phosphotransferase family protein n=1 Tax=Kineococcus terrestris TaxID=2044856 RepID=UPI0034DB2CF9